MTDSDDRQTADSVVTSTSPSRPTEAESSRPPLLVVGLGIGVLALVVVIAVLFARGGDDEPDRVSTGSDPAAETSTPLVDESTDAGNSDLSTTDAAIATDTVSADTVSAATETAATEPVVDSPVVTDAQVVASPSPTPASATASYRVTIDVHWVAATHPSTLPGNAHFSDPVIAVHGVPGAVFAQGQNASAGIEEMAEVGRTSTLLGELGSTPGVTFAESTGGIAAPAAASRSFDITVSQSESLISLVTMLAPSPDWFVGFADAPTFVDDQWIDSVTFPLGNYDAGTDSGPDFTSADSDTSPAQPVAGPRDDAFAAAVAEGAFGTVTITKIG